MTGIEDGIGQSEEDQINATECQQNADMLLHPHYSILQFILLFFSASTLSATLLLVHQFVRHRIVVHPNLLILFTNIVACIFANNFGYFIFIFRYKILLIFFHNPNGDPCQLMTPFWMVALLLGPMGLSTVAYPAFHFCVMLERFRATRLADKYENEGKGIVLWMAAIIWIFSFAYIIFIVISCFLETNGRPQTFAHLDSKMSAQFTISMAIFCLLLIILTPIFDWRITQINRRIQAKKKDINGGYSLSKIYQLNENALTMRLILPLDLAYALLYLLYSALTLAIREYKSHLDQIRYVFYFNACNALLFLYSSLTILVYIRFVRFVGKSKRRRNPMNGMPPLEEQAKFHFKQLESQWR